MPAFRVCPIYSSYPDSWTRHHFSIICVCVCVCVCTQMLSHVRLFVSPWTVPHQAPLSMGFSRHECWSGLPFPSPGALPYPGISCISCIGRQVLYPPSLLCRFPNWLAHLHQGSFSTLSKPCCVSALGWGRIGWRTRVTRHLVI